MSKSRSSIILFMILSLAAAGCGAIPDPLKAELKETAQAAVQDTTEALIQDFTDYVLEEVLDTGFDLPIDLNSNGIDLPSALLTEDDPEN